MVSSRKQDDPPVHQTPELNVRDRMITAYILWLFLGVFGAHRFYLGQARSGLTMGFIGPLFLSFGLVFYFLKGLGVSPLLVMSPFILWWLIDACLIPNRVRQLGKD
ncbi:TM2 domain-containing protein [Salinithrix halophila]|uniref:TM2 domain-containing protein n=1 Tax=Salinithrix halophila TaxID=1485204 RepID=A0ABV8JI75_9BACL